MFKYQDLKINENKFLLKSFSVVLILFLFISTIYIFTSIQNKIKEGKYIGQDLESRNTISVSGIGEIYVKPDLAITSFSVVTEKKEIAEAMEENTQKMNTIINSIKEQGVEEKDLKTIGFNIYPRYEWYEKTLLYPNGKRVLVGYEIRQSLEVKIRDMGKIGTIIQKATDAGANQIGNLQFTIDQEEEFKKQARESAIKEAKEKAEELASQLGIKLVRIVNFNESKVMPYFYDYKTATNIETIGEVAPQIEVGENKIKVTVNIIYEIN